MHSETDPVDTFISVSRTSGTLPLPPVWERALAGDITPEEAARSREGLDPPELIELYRRLCRPADDLEHRRVIAAVTRRRWLRPALGWAVVAALLLLISAQVFRDRPRGGDLVASGEPLPNFVFDIHSVRNDVRSANDRGELRVGLADPVLWTIVPERDVRAADTARLFLYVRTGITVRQLDVEKHVTRSAKSGAYKVEAASLRELLGDSPTGETTVFAVVVRYGVRPPTGEDAVQCRSTEQSRCAAITVTVE